VKISILVEGKTEKVFLPHLRAYLHPRLSGKMPRLSPVSFDGRIPREDKLRRIVANLLSGSNASDYVIALTDVYTGTVPPDFVNATDAKEKMRRWVGDEPRFHPHAAQHDFEAWLLPYWETIKRLAGSTSSRPSGNSEDVNHNDPPAHRLARVFETGTCRDSYVKTRDAGRILRESNLALAIQECGELKAMINTILRLCGGDIIQ
jgi:hypothetical protein